MKTQFKLGEVVKLKSGGPKMTIIKVSENGSTWCSYFDSNENYHRVPLDAEAIEIFEEKESELNAPRLVEQRSRISP
jgi:uncharacterized protein YodC (DUF2158 family)